MGNHRSGMVSPQESRGRHRKPTTAGRNAARVAAAGVLLSAPVTMGAGVASASSAPVAPAGVLAVPTGVLDEIARCESGGSYTAQNPTSSASGKYQFIDSTWRAYRGSSTAARAKDASPAEQEAAARRLYAAEGTTPWNASKSCWGGRVSAGDPVGGGSTEGAAPKKAAPKKAAPKATAPKAAAKKKAPAASASMSGSASGSSSRSASADVSVVKDGHVVVSGDTLSELAFRYTGDADWRELHEMNRKVVGDNPHLIFPGQVLQVRK